MSQGYPQPSAQERLAQQMEKLTHEMERRNSFWRALMLGVVRGIGMVLGATILAAVALALLWRIAQRIGLEDVIGQLGVPIPTAPASGESSGGITIPPALLEQFRGGGARVR